MADAPSSCSRPSSAAPGMRSGRGCPLLGEVTGDVLILYGDTPLLRPETIERMRAVKRETGAADLVMLTAQRRAISRRRVVRDADGRVARIVEAQDATARRSSRSTERNTGVYLLSMRSCSCARASMRSQPHNAQGELYLTDVVGFAVERRLPRRRAAGSRTRDECLGINTRRELAEAAAVLRRRIVERLMDDGVSFVDPDSRLHRRRRSASAATRSSSPASSSPATRSSARAATSRPAA